MISLYAYNAQYGEKLRGDLAFYTARPLPDERNAIFAPIFAQFTDGMSDREKVEICVKAVCDRFDYEVNGGFSWTNGKTTGDCDDFSTDERNAIFAPIFAQFTDGMSDREKVEICVKAVCDRFDYEVNGGFSWTNGKTTGDCDDFSSAIEQIVGAAGIPCYQLNGKVRDGAHAWNHVFIDGTWYALDGGAADVGHPIILTMSQHEELYGYPHSMNVGGEIDVTQALVETAERYR